ncbi:MAG: InlB B-repeat-containing protein [Endomicrobium sp.]|jgi:uncharacterized repeat protein (TIGR02543 family)|nr:InlB B-repeat-containing protein [Endomicrobium sp.]
MRKFKILLFGVCLSFLCSFFFTPKCEASNADTFSSADSQQEISKEKKQGLGEREDNKKQQELDALQNQNKLVDDTTEDNDEQQEEDSIYYSVTFKYQGKVIDIKQVKEGEFVTAPNINLKKYEHITWEDSSTGEVFDFSTPIMSDKLIIGSRDIIAPPGEPERFWTLLFDSNGGSEIADSPWKLSYSDLPLNLPKTTRDGYIFLGWYDVHGVKWVDGPVKNQKNTVLIAHWQKIQMNYDVSPKTADGNNIMLYTFMLIIGAVVCGIVRKRNKEY